MREAVIVASSRTPLAKSFRGSFNMTRPDDFTAHTIKDVLGKVPQLDAKEEVKKIEESLQQPRIPDHDKWHHHVFGDVRHDRLAAGFL